MKTYLSHAAILLLLVVFSYRILRQNEPTVFYAHHISYSPDGTKIATNGYEFVRVWDAQTKALLFDLPVDGYVTNHTWSPDGTRLASVTGIEEINIWNVAGADRTVGTLEKEFTLEELRYGFYEAIDWSSDGKYLSVGGVIDTFTCVLDGETYEYIDCFAPSGTSLIWKPNDNSLLAAADIESGVWLVPFGGSAGIDLGRRVGSKAIAWNDEGTRLAIGYVDGVVQLWDVEESKSVWQYETDGVFIETISWSRDGANIATASGNAVLRVWDSATGDLLQASENLRATSAVYSPTEDKLAYGFLYDTINVLDVEESLLPFPTFTPAPTESPTATPRP